MGMTCCTSLIFVCRYRWKGENVATSEVADILTLAQCLLEANVYGVKVEGENSPVEMLNHILQIL